MFHSVSLCPLLLALAAPAPGRPGSGLMVPHRVPHGIADPAGTTGYFVDDKGNLEAVRLDTGQRVWKHPGPVHPLALWRKQVVVAVPVKGSPDRLRIVVLDGDGIAWRETRDLVLPGHRKGAAGLWHVQAYVDGDSLLLDWQVDWDQPGAPKVLTERSSGRTRVNLKTGTIDSLTAAQWAEVGPHQLPTALEKALKGLPKDHHYVHGGGWSNEPQRLFDGNRLGVVWRTAIDRDEVLTLRTWDVATGKDVRTKTLLRRTFGNHLSPSADGRYLFFQDQPMDRADRPHRYSWEVYRVATGERVGTFLHHGFTIDAGVVGGRLLVVDERTMPNGRRAIHELHAWDLKAEKRLWRRPAAGWSRGFPVGQP